MSDVDGASPGPVEEFERELLGTRPDFVGTADAEAALMSFEGIVIHEADPATDQQVRIGAAAVDTGNLVIAVEAPAAGDGVDA